MIRIHRPQERLKATTTRYPGEAHNYSSVCVDDGACLLLTYSAVGVGDIHKTSER